MAELHVELLGSLRLNLGGRVLPTHGAKKAKALLAYLASEPGRPFNRETLAEFLWPDRFEKQAQQSFRQALSAIRKMLDDETDRFLIADDGSVSLDSTLVSTDVQQFEALHGSTDRADMARATEIYGDDFLSNIGSISPDFDHWVEQERTRLKALALPLFERLVIANHAAGAIPEAIEVAQRLVEIDPAHEAGHRHLMRLYIAQGQKTAAFRQYEACRHALAQMLDAEPDRETLALLDEIRAHSEDVSEPGASNPAPSDPAVSSVGDTKTGPDGTDSPRRSRKTAWAAGLSAALVVTFVILWPRSGDQADMSGTSRAPLSVTDEGTERTCAALRPTALTGEPVLLLLPIRSFGEDEILTLFAPSATDAIQSMSSSVPGVTLLAGPFLGHPDVQLSPQELATKNVATHVFDTTVRSDGSGHRIAMRIIEGSTGKQVWQTVLTSDTLRQDPGRVQNTIAIRAALGIQEQLTEGTQALAYAQYEAESLAVFEHNTRGYGLIGQTRQIYNELARREFEAVLELDPDNPRAHAGMGYYYLSPIIFRWPDASANNLTLAARHAQASADANPGYAPAKNLQAITFLFEGEYERALQKMEEGLRLHGNGADSSALAGYILSFTDQRQRSLDIAARAMRLRPYTSPLWYQWSFARSLRISGNAQGAITCLTEIDYEEQGVIAPALELIQAWDEVGKPEKSAPYVDLVSDRTSGTFSASRSCRAPAYQDEAMTNKCIAALTRAGLPE